MSDAEYWKRVNEKMGNDLFKQINSMGRRDAIVFIANKYRDRTMKNNFFRDNRDYPIVAHDFGLTNQQLYMWFTFKLRINQLSNPQNCWDYYTSPDASKKAQLEKQRKREKDIKTNAYFYTAEVWKLLALYSTYLPHNDVKRVFRQLENAFYQKNCKRVKEIFTPLWYEEDVGLKMLFCRITRRKKKGVYEGVLLENGMKKTEMRERLLNTRCLVFTDDLNQRNEINEKMIRKCGCKIIGLKPVPHRSLTNHILKIE